MSASEVAEHYNNVRQTRIQERKESRIFYLRNMNNWIKSQLINEAMDMLKASGVQRPRILDLACGKGGDLRKWDIAKAGKVVMADVASVSIDQAKERYQKMRGSDRFDAEFIVADCTKDILKEKMEEKELFDLTSCQFAMHYSFVDEKSAKTFIKNAVDSLKPGGIFIGTLPDADRIMWAVRSGKDGIFSNDVVKIRYENLDELEDGKTPLFGAKFHFTLDSQVNCPEFLAYFPLVKYMLEQEGMELILVKNFAEAVHDWMDKGKQLLTTMKGVETYPPIGKLAGKEDEYEAAKKKIEKIQSNELKQVGTISKSEWEAICMYLVFAFRKREKNEETDDNSKSKEEQGNDLKQKEETVKEVNQEDKTSEDKEETNNDSNKEENKSNTSEST